MLACDFMLSILARGKVSVRSETSGGKVFLQTQIQPTDGNELRSPPQGKHMGADLDGFFDVATSDPTIQKHAGNLDMDIPCKTEA